MCTDGCRELVSSRQGAVRSLLVRLSTRSSRVYGLAWPVVQESNASRDSFAKMSHHTIHICQAFGGKKIDTYTAALSIALLFAMVVSTAV